MCFLPHSLRLPSRMALTYSCGANNIHYVFFAPIASSVPVCQPAFLPVGDYAIFRLVIHLSY